MEVMMFIWRKGLILLFVLALGIAGCGTTGFQQSFGTRVKETNIVAVKVNVRLERAYVQSVSNLGAGAVGMLVLLGPFSNNVVTLYGTTQEKSGEKMKTIYLIPGVGVVPEMPPGSFSKGLRWGDNSFDIRVPRNSEIQFSLRSGGTRSGFTDIGFAEIGSEPTQTVVISLTAAGATIE